LRVTDLWHGITLAFYIGIELPLISFHRRMQKDRVSEGQWPRIHPQDLESIPFVQKGMKSMGFIGSLTNPIAEKTVAHFQHHLRKVLGLSE